MRDHQHPFNRQLSSSLWNHDTPDTYDKPWLTDVTVGECQHASSLGEVGAVRNNRDTPESVHIYRDRHIGGSLPPLMGHCYRSPLARPTEWRCQKCGVLWEENRRDPQWCGAQEG